MLKRVGIIGITCSTAIMGSYFLYKKLNKNQNMEKKEVLLVGYGYAGRAFYSDLDKSKYNIKIILEENLTVMQPHFLDSLEKNNTKKIICKIDELNKDFKTNNKIVSVDLENKCVNAVNKNYNNSSIKYNYDYLIMAIGHETNTFGISGVDKYCKFYSSQKDLENLRNLSRDKKLKIAVVGASLAGLEIAGYLSDNHEVHVIEYASNILPTFKTTTQNDVFNLMSLKHKIIFKLNTRLLKIEETLAGKKAVFTEINGKINEKNDYDVVIWTAGIKSNENMNKLLNTNEVNEYLQIKNKNNIFAIGDCNNTTPKSGQNAKRQGEYLARIFNSDFKNKNKFKFNSMGTIIKLPNCVYIENKYYSGFAPRFIHEIIHYLNI